MLLKNSQISLRAVEPEDLEILYKWENSTELWVHGNTLAPYSKLVLREYINNAIETDIYQSKQLRLMIDLIDKDGDMTIGTIDLYDIDPHNRRAGIGILIDETHRKKQYATQALELTRDYAFNFLRLHQIYAYISLSNTKSISLFEKADFKHVGILKDWVQRGERFEDVQLCQLINKSK